MCRKLGALLAACAMVMAANFAVAPLAYADDLPQAPTLVMTPATCDAKVNTLTLSGLTGVTADSNYRFVLSLNDQVVKQLNTAERAQLLQGSITAEDLGVGSAAAPYGSKVTVQTYWFDKEKTKDQALWQTVNFAAGPALVRAIPLGAPVSATLVDPATLNCPTAPAATLPATPDFTLHAATCGADTNKNRITVTPAQVRDGYRFVVSMGTHAVSMRDEFRAQLWTNGSLALEDVLASYPGVTPAYGEQVTVQAYWFDKDQVFDAAQYDTALALSAGSSARFIKLGDAKTVTIADPAKTCPATAPTNDDNDSASTTTPVATTPKSVAKPQVTAKANLRLAKTGLTDSGAIGAVLLLVGAGAVAIASRKDARR